MDVMKLYDQALSMTTLNQAWRKVKENRGRAGTDGETITAFGRGLTAKLVALRDAVRERRYRPRPLLEMRIERPGKKPRVLAIPSVRDRILQTAVALVLTPLFEAEFEDCSFGYRRGRSIDQAVRRIMRYRDEGFRWVVDADISSFFDEIDRSILQAELTERVPDPRLLHLISLWLDAEIDNGVTRRRLSKGLPQGSPLSPILSNLYLDHLDEALIGENLRLIRYADDFLILCKNREQAEEALELTADVLAALKLTLNQTKTRIIDFERGFRFLGVQFVKSLVLQCRYPETTAADVDKNLPQPAPVAAPELDAMPMSSEPAEPAPPSALALALQEALAEQPDDAHDKVVIPAKKRELSAYEAGDQSMVLVDEREPSSASEPHLQTLYVTEHGCVLGKEYERFIVRREGQVLQEIPALKVDQIMIFGNSQITTQAMQFCLLEKIPIVLLSGKGRYYGVVDSMDTDPVLLHRDQFACAADERFCLRVAKAIVQGKLANMRLILRRYARKREAEALRQTDSALRAYSQDIDQATTLDQLRGYEGTVSKQYFQGLRTLLTPEWGFEKRVRQPPTDPANSLLSYGYTLLFYNVYSLARARGINAHVGFLHPLRAGHPALISDLMEEFRSLIVDALVLTLILNQRLQPTDFILPEAPGAPCLLSDSARKQFIHAFEAKMNATVTHPLSGLQLDYRRCIDQQVQLMASVIRGRRESYQAMVLR